MDVRTTKEGKHVEVLSLRHGNPAYHSGGDFFRNSGMAALLILKDWGSGDARQEIFGDEEAAKEILDEILEERHRYLFGK